MAQLDGTQSGGGRELEEGRLSSLGLRRGFCSEAPGGTAGQNPEVEVEEKGLWKWGNPLYGSSFRGTWKGAPLLGTLKVLKGRLWE